MRSRLPDKQFDGVSITEQNASGFLLTELFYEPDTKISKHWHEQANFCIATSGSCNEIYEGKYREFQALTWNFLPAGDTHSLIISRAGMRAFSIKIAPCWLERAREYSLAIEAPVHSTGGTLGWLLLKLYREYQNMDEASPLTVEGLVLEMLAEVSRSRVKRVESHPPRWLRQAKDFLHAHFSESLQLANIAGAVSVHPGHLAREFHRHYRCTIGEYIRRLRIEQTCREIVLSDSSLAQIALSAGFSDQSHFSRIFKRQTGMSPAEYRAVFSPR